MRMGVLDIALTLGLIALMLGLSEQLRNNVFGMLLIYLDFDRVGVALNNESIR